VAERMPVRASKDRIRVAWLTALCVFDALYGAVTMFGKTESAPQMFLRGIGLPPPFWGFLLFGAAALIWWGFSVPGAGVAAFAWGALGAASLLTITNGTAAAYTGPIVYGYVAYQHAMIIHQVGSGLDRDRERRQRGTQE